MCHLGFHPLSLSCASSITRPELLLCLMLSQGWSLISEGSLVLLAFVNGLPGIGLHGFGTDSKTKRLTGLPCQDPLPIRWAVLLLGAKKSLTQGSRRLCVTINTVSRQPYLKSPWSLQGMKALGLRKRDSFWVSKHPCPGCMVTEKGSRPSRGQGSVTHGGCCFFWEPCGPLRKSQVAGLRRAADALVTDADFAKRRVLSVLSLFLDPNCSAKLHWKTPLVKDLSSRE